MMESQPLVSVGIPTYNRPEGLRRTLSCITGQTYKNLEIIVSDNCSTDSKLEDVIREFREKDNRIKSFRQNRNIGGGNNFKFVLSKSTGEYFMWAADDDYYCNYYINYIIKQFKNLAESSVVAINMEAQYFDINVIEPFPFFSEGAPFYSFHDEDKVNRIRHILENNYGNLIYSIYKADVLKSIDMIFAENEIPFFIQIAEKGNWLVIPKIGFFKKTTLKTYNKAKWEKEGGILPDSFFSFEYYKSLRRTFLYHKSALENILKSITSLNVGEKTKHKLAKLVGKLIWVHFGYFVIRYKWRVPKQQ